MSKFYNLSKKNIKVVDFFLKISPKYDYFFIKDGKMLREISDKIGNPIKPDKESFIKNGYEDILNNYISGVRYISETKLFNVFIE